MTRLEDPMELPALTLLGLGGNDTDDKGAWDDAAMHAKEARPTLQIIWN
jgi:hypothetical protein